MPRAIASTAVLLLASVATLSATAADWTTFRGADRTAVAPDTDLLDAWPENGPPLLWESTGCGRGYASPTIAGDRIYILGDGLSRPPMPMNTSPASTARAASSCGSPRQAQPGTTASRPGRAPAARPRSTATACMW
jgi:hypothetical protein